MKYTVTIVFILQICLKYAYVCYHSIYAEIRSYLVQIYITLFCLVLLDIEEEKVLFCSSISIQLSYLCKSLSILVVFSKSKFCKFYFEISNASHASRIKVFWMKANIGALNLFFSKNHSMYECFHLYTQWLSLHIGFIIDMLCQTNARGEQIRHFVDLLQSQQLWR